MRDCSNNRDGFDRVLSAVAASFLVMTASAAIAGQTDALRASPAELAIEAAIPRPEPANVPPPTAADFKLDTTATIQTGAAKDEPKPADAAPAAADSAKPVEQIGPAATLAQPEAPSSAPASPAPASPAAASTQPADSASEPPKESPKDVVKEEPKPATPETTKAASNVPAADQPVADKLKEMLATKSLRYFDRRGERAAVEKFYGSRDYAPVWTQSGALTAAAKGVVARLKDAASDGLTASDYPVPDFAAATTPDALAEAELKLTDSMLTYARHAQSGRMHWSQVSADISYPEHPTDPAEVLNRVTGAKDASSASANLESYNPPHKLYQQLRAKLAELRGEGSHPAIEIADGPVLRYVPARGKKQAEVVVEDARVPQLRAKLGVESPDDAHYDAKVADAVRRFQDSVDLKATGALDPATVRALNTPKHDRQIDTIIVNMERWRWLPRDLGAPAIGDAYVILNIPDYTLKVMQHGQQVWTTRVVTGKPGVHATPLLTETMKYITVNPTWNVPPSIVYNEYLPALQQDPTVLERMGLRLERERDGSIHISQPPGEANALGRVRFNFPNKFLVYQHDTPDKYLFEKSERAFSHGCMRVQYPDQYASVLLNITEPNEHYTPEKIRAMYGHSEIDLKFPTPIPVNITYQTAFVDDGGKLQFRKDVYGRDATMIAMLKGARGRDLENVVAHAQPSYGGPARLPPSVNVASENSFSSGPNFFERLFGGGQQMTPPAPIGRRRPLYQQQGGFFTR